MEVFAKPAAPPVKAGVQENYLDYFIGDSRITVTFHYKEGMKILMMQPHSEEETAWDAALQVLGESGGLLAHISKVDGEDHTDRNVTVTVNGKKVHFNPNRMFTDEGLRKNLAKQNLDAETYERAFSDIRKFCTNVLERCWDFFKPEWVLAVHNDYNGIAFYKEFGKDSHDAPGKDKRDFYFLTQKSDFERLSSMGYNAVLQKDDPVDDGSASVYFKDMRYINTEGKNGDVETQVRMIKDAIGIK